MSFAFAPPPVPFVEIRAESIRFPVRRILCVGRNYADHAREMGSDPEREPPFFFTKPGDAVVSGDCSIAYPPLTADFHHEVELVVALGSGGRDVSAARALELVFGYAVGLDLTRRDLQAAARKEGRPWDWAKAFDRSAPCSAIVRVADCGHPASGAIWLSVNGTRKQSGDLADLIWSVPEVIAAASRSIELAAGDLIFTGTPAGVGPLRPGDRVHCGIDGVAELRATVVEPALG